MTFIVPCVYKVGFHQFTCYAVNYTSEDVNLEWLILIAANQKCTKANTSVTI